MSLRLQDMIAYAGGDCLRLFGTPVWRTTRAEDVPATVLRTSEGWSLDRYGRLRAASSGRLRVQWVDSTGDGVLDTPAIVVETERTNVVLYARDLTDAGWTKTNCTAALDEVGIDGFANSASSLTATGANATCLRAITLGSSDRFQSAYVKRITGSGTVEMTMDNGATWTAVSVGADWSRVSIPAQTLANPTVGFRIVTSGDAIAIDIVQNEVGENASGPIPTAGSTVTRDAESFSAPMTARPQAVTAYLKFLEDGDENVRLFGLGSPISSPRFYGTRSSSGYSVSHEGPSGNSITSTVAAGSVGSIIELLGQLDDEGAARAMVRIDGGAVTQTAWATATPLGPAWSAAEFNLNGLSSLGIGTLTAPAFKLARGLHDMDPMAAAFKVAA